MNDLTITRRVRPYQRALHEYMMKGGKRAIEIAHRRWGKDEMALMVACELAHRRPATYWHCLPEYGQARKALWTAVNPHTGIRRIDEAFPRQIRARTLEDEMFIEFKNKSTWQLIGSDRYNATVGAGPAGIVYSEWALANPSAWAYHRPMIEENGGWAMFITTPRGKNHAYAMLNRAQDSDNWFAEVSTVHDTRALTQEQLDEALGEYQDLYGKDIGLAYFEQEYLCSFDAAIPGAYYGGEMRLAREQGRITNVQHDPSLPVFTAWDIGFTDDTVILFFQVTFGEVRIIDCYDASGQGPEHYAEIIKAKPYHYGGHWLPHDAQAGHMVAAGRTLVEQLRDNGLSNLHVLPNKQTEQQGIMSVRKMFPKLWIDGAQEILIEAITQFQREWDDDRKCFKDQPRRDWTNHFADALRYLSWVWREPTKQPDEKKNPVISIGGKSTMTMNDLLKTVRKRNVRDR
jgi:phage terminase large subunit